MPDRIRVTDTARAELRKLPDHVRQNASRIIESLGNEPTPVQAKERRGLLGRYRIRLFAWRILSQPEDESVFILPVRQKTGPGTYRGIEDVE
jgi:mRNA-degrading endonuclease RelE of RelBE toxin-antitoxin system